MCHCGGSGLKLVIFIFIFYYYFASAVIDEILFADKHQADVSATQPARFGLIIIHSL